MKRNHIVLILLVSVLVMACLSMPVFAGMAVTPVRLSPTAQSPSVDIPVMIEPTVPSADDRTPNQQPSEPTAVTSVITNVRTGPGIDYPISYQVQANESLSIRGISPDGGWWAVPGPVEGPGPVNWVSAEVVRIQGDTGGLPVIPAAPLTPETPRIGNPGEPTAEGCVVSHPGPGDLGPVYVYSLPEQRATSIVGQFGLNLWVSVIGRDNSWYHIQDAEGNSGWVPVDHVAHTGACQADDGPGSNR